MLTINGNSLTIQQVVKVAREKEKVVLSKEAKDRILKNRGSIEKILNTKDCIYGINTGFGDLANKKISKLEIEKLQKNLIRSHSCSVGNYLSEEIVRAVILLRANCFAKGHSGVRLELVETLIEMLNKNLIPLIAEKGSVGASGDLSPLAHLSLVLIGEGKATFNGEILNGKKAMEKAKIKILNLEAKEGLALINGTSVMSAIACFIIHDAEILLKNAIITSALSLEALKGTNTSFDERIMNVRNQNGQKEVAKILRELLKGSKILLSHKNCEKVQDAYTLRCIPQVLGSVKDTIDFAKKIVEVEVNSATDNPLIFGNEVLSGGNFHGMPIALSMDYLGIALTNLANFSERRTARLLDAKLSGLPPFLTEKSGLNSGFMILQYTSASLCAENRVLATPSSIHNIPTSANQEDFNSMATTSARKCMEILKNCQYVVAIELLCAVQGIEFHKEKTSEKLQEVVRKVRKVVKRLEEDRVMKDDLEKIREIMMVEL